MLRQKPPLSPPPASELSVGEVSNISSHQADVSVQSVEGARRTTPRQTAATAKKASASGAGSEMSATKVFVRVRPFNQKELHTKGVDGGAAAESSGATVTVDPANNLRPIVKIEESKPSLITTLDPQKNYAPRNTYVFERCFDSAKIKFTSGAAAPSAGAKTLEEAASDTVTEEDIKNADEDQRLLYTHVGKPVLDNALEGYNGCVFAYGQTGSGKTFTMMGPPTLFGSATAAGAGAATNRKFSRANTATPTSHDNMSFDGADAKVKRLNHSAQGIIPRLSRELFEALNRSRTNDSAVSFRVELEYFEIYNEKVMDLLHTGPAGASAELRVRNAASGPYVEGLERVHVESVEDILRYLRKGNNERHTASTKMNDRSSRSHAILSLYITQMRLTTVGEEGGFDNDSVASPPGTTKSGSSNPATPTTLAAKKARPSAARADNEIVERKKSKINLVDLAGSERTGASEVKGAHFKEATNINLSLTTLGRVIDALADLSQMQSHHDPTGSGNSGAGSKSPKGGARGSIAPSTSGYGVFVPYRDSNLTWLLRDSLGGNSKTTMIATVSPHYTNFEEACQTLRYASRAKQIMTKAIVNEDPQQRLIKQLTAEVERLKRALASGKGDDNGTMEEDEAYMEELRERVQELEAELADRTAELDRAEAEIVTLRNALQQKASASKSEVKAVAKEGEAKALKLRADVQKLENENLNMAILEDDLRKEQEKNKTMERRIALTLRQAEKESKAQQVAIRKLEKENRELERERDRLAVLRADIRAAEERENELVARLRQMEVQREEMLATQRSTVVAGDGSDGALQLSQGSLQRLEALGFLPQAKTGKGRQGSSTSKEEPLQLGRLVDSLIHYAANCQEQAQQAQDLSLKLVEDRGGAASSRGTQHLNRMESTNSSLDRTTNSATTGSPRGRPGKTKSKVSTGPSNGTANSSSSTNERKLAKQLKQTEAELTTLRETADAERAELQKQLLEKTDSHRRAQMELKRLKEELKAEKEQQTASERRLMNEHNDAMRRLQEEIREKKVAVKETRKQQKDLSATLSAAHEKELTDITEEREKLQCNVAKLTREKQALQKKKQDTEDKLAASEAVVAQYQGKLLEDFMAGKPTGRMGKEKAQSLTAAFLQYEAMSRAALESEAVRSLRAVQDQEDLLIAVNAERCRAREEAANRIALCEEKASADVAAVEDALAVERSEHARKQELLKEFMQAVKAQKENAAALQAKLDEQAATLRKVEASCDDLAQQLQDLQAAKRDLLDTMEAMRTEQASQEEHIQQLEATNAQDEEAHIAQLQDLKKEHSAALVAEQQLQMELTDKCAQLSTRLVEVEGEVEQVRAEKKETDALASTKLQAAESRVTELQAVVSAEKSHREEAETKLWAVQRTLVEKDALAVRAGCARMESQERAALAITAHAESMKYVAEQEEAVQAQLAAAKENSSREMAKLDAAHKEAAATQEEQLASLKTELEAASAAMAAESATHAQETGAWEDKLKVAQDKLAELVAKSEALQVQLDEAESAHQEEKASLVKQLETLRAEHETALQVHDTKQRAWAEEMQSAVLEKEAALVTLQAEQTELTRKVAELKGRYGESLKAQTELQERLEVSGTEYKASLEEKETTIATLEAQLEEHTEKHSRALTEAHAEVKERDNHYQQLKAEFDALVEKDAGLQERLDALTTAKSSAEEAHAATVASLQERLTDSEAKHEDARQAHEAAVSALRTTAAEKEKQHEAEMQAAHDTVEQLRKELASANARTAEAETRLEQLGEKSAEDLAKLTSAKEKLEEELRKSEEARRQVVQRGLETQAAHTAELSALQSTHESLQATADATTAKLAEAEEALKGVQAALAGSESTVNQLTTEKTALEAEVNRLTVELAASQDARDGLSATHATIKAELEKANADLKNELSQLQSQLKDVEDKATSLQTKLDADAATHEKAAQDHASTVDALRKEMVATQESHDNAVTEMQSALRATEAALETAKAELGAELDSVRARLTSAVATSESLQAQLTAEVAAHEADTAGHLQTLAALQNEAKVTQETHEQVLKEQEAARKSIEADLAATRNELVSVKTDLETELQQKNTELSELHQKLTEAEDKTTSLQAQLDTQAAEREADTAEHKTAMDALLREKETAQQEHEQARKDADAALQALKTDLTATHDELASVKKDLETQLQEKTSQLTELEKQVADIAASLVEAKREAAEAATAKEAEVAALVGAHETVLAAKNQDIKDLDADLAAVNVACEETKSALAHVQAQHGILQKELDALKTTSAATQAKLELEKTGLQSKLNTEIEAHAAVEKSLAETQAALAKITEDAAAAEKLHAEQVSKLGDQVAELTEQLELSKKETQSAQDKLREAQEDFTSSEAQMADKLASLQTTIEELRGQLETLSTERDAQDDQLAQLQEKLVQDTKAFTAAAEKREQEVTRLREDLEFRTNMDLCEADGMSFAAPSNNSFADITTAGMPSALSRGGVTTTTAASAQGTSANTGGSSVGGVGGIGSMISSFFGKGRDTGSNSNNTAAAAAAAARRASFMPPLAPLSSMGSSSNATASAVPSNAPLAAHNTGMAALGPAGSGTSHNNSFADLTVHDLLSSSSVGGPLAGGSTTPLPGTPSASAGGASRTQQASRSGATTPGGPAPFERRASQYAGAGIKRGPKSAIRPNASGTPAVSAPTPTDLTPAQGTAATTSGPLQPKQENILPGSQPRGTTSGSGDGHDGSTAGASVKRKTPHASM